MVEQREQCIYTSCYCEENIWKFCEQWQQKNKNIENLYVVFISNDRRQIPIWKQKSARQSQSPVIWDYHVILVQKNSNEPSKIYDLDTTLTFPVSALDYIQTAIGYEHRMPKKYHRMFRVIPAGEFLHTFASDRSHMLDENGVYRSAPPSYPCISCETVITSEIEILNVSVMNNLNANIFHNCCQFDTSSEEETLAALTLMQMLQRKRETIITTNIENYQSLSLSRKEINEVEWNNISIKRRCNKQHDNLSKTMTHSSSDVLTIDQSLVLEDHLKSRDDSASSRQPSRSMSSISSDSGFLCESSSSCSVENIREDEQCNWNMKKHKKSMSTITIDSSHQTILSKKKEKKELTTIPCSRSKKYLFNTRTNNENMQLLAAYQVDGLDTEDMYYVKRSFQILVKDRIISDKLHWTDQPAYDIKICNFDNSDQDCARIHPWTYKANRQTSFSSLSSSSSCYNNHLHNLKSRKRLSCYAKTLKNDKSKNVLKRQKQSFNIRERILSPTKLMDSHRTLRHEQRSFYSIINQSYNGLIDLSRLKFRNHRLNLLKSSIHGLGVFTSVTIQLGELIMEYVGEVIRSSIADKREKESELNGKRNYMFRVDRDIIIDASRYGNISRFLNHSCTPNCSAKIIHTSDNSQIVLYANMIIHQGEELTYDYKFPKETHKIRCYCQSSKCRGTLN